MAIPYQVSKRSARAPAAGRPLRKTVEDADLGDAFAPPQDVDSLGEITRELSRLVGRERTRTFIEGVIAEAGVEATPAEAWLLGRADGGAVREATVAAVRDGGDRERLREGLARLRERGLLARGELDGAAPLSDAGQRVRAERLAARCRSLETLVADWRPESPEVDAMIERLAEELGRPRVNGFAEPSARALSVFLAFSSDTVYSAGANWGKAVVRIQNEVIRIWVRRVARPPKGPETNRDSLRDKPGRRPMSKHVAGIDFSPQLPAHPAPTAAAPSTKRSEA